MQDQLWERFIFNEVEYLTAVKCSLLIIAGKKFKINLGVKENKAFPLRKRMSSPWTIITNSRKLQAM
jgi:hypothetical protein